MTIYDWFKYFEGLAKQHRLIRHTDKQKHYFRAELEDFYQDIRSKAKFPAVMLESSLMDLRTELTLGTMVRTLSFVVVDNCRADDYLSITDTQSECEEIAISFLGRLQEDIHNDELSGVRFVSAHFEPLANVPLHYYGQRVEVVVTEPICLHNPNDWQ